MAKRWAKILNSLPHARRVAALPTYGHKWAYVCLHLSNLGNYHGQFFYPEQMLSIDMPCAPEDARSFLIDLVDAGLIEHDRDEQFVRIVGWHLKANSPENPSTVTNRARELTTLAGPASMTRATIAEFILSAHRKLEDWRPDTRPFADMEHQINKTLQHVLRQHGEALVEAIIAAGLTEIDERLFGEMQSRVENFDTVFARCGHGVDTHRLRQDLEKTETETERETKTERETGRTTTSRKARSNDSKPPAATDAALQQQVETQLATRGGVPGHEWVDDPTLERMKDARLLGQSSITAYKRMRREHST